ncbi:NWD2 [Trichophyton equinum CBS 127.97]|uniref:Mitochondrial division protein 1 n=1 Tax=Trichophyton equinum (strain ATCC MYA-4606 / CBS 127.97) TaxID=559882 RepID=F2PRQ7_TRIEC|nr:NWD2 [Trichophyton equinum CBS 127.97]
MASTTTGTDYHTLRSTDNANTWFNYFENFRRPIDKYSRGIVRRGTRAKVAILDSGIDISHTEISAKDKKRIIDCRSFLLDRPVDDAGDSDSVRHGTQIAVLLLKRAPFADIYVARVKEDEDSPLNPESVAKAIEYAIHPWDVDIISMSWGFGSEYDAVASAIRKAFEKRKIMFVAASNAGANILKPIFPANMPEVICINSTDGYGKVSNFNPPPQKDNYNFCTLGEAVLDSWKPNISSGIRDRDTGTSFATPLAAAIAASFIEFFRQDKFGRLEIPDSLKSEVRTREGMLKIFVAISENFQGFNYLRPWSLLDCKGNCGDRCVEARESAGRKLSNILHDAVPSPSDCEMLTSAPILAHAVAADVRALVHEREPTCLVGTRVELFRRIEAWAEGTPEKCICWLSGRLGTGKSTISRTIALQYFKQGQLGGTLFFSKNEKDLRTLSKFVSSLAHQLSGLAPSLRVAISMEKRHNTEVEQLAMGIQWEKLICNPLSLLKPRDSPLIMVIDALDECEGLNKRQIMGIINLFIDAAALQNIQLRFLITSRPESHIQAAFKESSQNVYHIELDKLDKFTVDLDISQMFREELGNLHTEKRGIEAHWPSEEYISRLTERANGLFIYAAITCRYIKEPGATSTNERLTRIFQNQAFDSLDNMYDHILTQAVTGPEKEVLVEQFQMILGTIVALFEPMPETSLCELCPKSLELEVVCSRLDSLHSILVIPESPKEPVHISHQSFREFLLRKREGDRRIWINEQMHQDLFTSCIRLLASNSKYGLRRDICGLKHPGIEINQIDRARIEEYLSIHTAYASRHWIYHLQELDPLQRQDVGLCDNGLVHNFLLDHLLHWLEALSLLGESSEGMRTIQLLSSMINANVSPQLYAFVEDAKRFIRYNRAIIEQAPLQVYFSALVFAPEQSLLRKHFAKDMPSWIARYPKVQPKWTLLRQTLGYLAGKPSQARQFISPAFSNDGTLITSISRPPRQVKSFRVWDTTTGALLNTDESLRDADFSPSEKLVVSVNCSNTVKISDAVTGTVIRVLETTGHGNSEICSVAFSPDGKLLVVWAAQMLVQIWDVESGTMLRTLERCHCPPSTGDSFDMLSHLAFSSDNGLIGASIMGARPETWSMTCIWNAADGSVVYQLKGCYTYTFSPDSKLIAFRIAGATRILDAGKRSVLYTIDACIDMAFSLDGKLAVVQAEPGSPGATQISFRIAATGKSTGVTIYLKGSSTPDVELRHMDIDHMVFSPDGKLLATYNWACYMRLWDVASGELVELFKNCNSVSFSPDGTVMASGSPDNLIRIWDVPTPTSGHFIPVINKAKDAIKRLWTAQASEEKIASAYGGNIFALVLSPDGKLAASGGCGLDPTGAPVVIWDVASGVPLQQSKLNYYINKNILFWPSDKRLVSADACGRLVSWDAPSLEELPMIDESYRPILNMAILPDKGLVLVALDIYPPELMHEEYHIYDFNTGKFLRELNGHHAKVEALAFSSDGRLIATGSSRAVKVWSTDTGEMLREHKTMDICQALAFSTDGERLLMVSGPRQKQYLREVITKTTLCELPDCNIWQLLPSSTQDDLFFTNCGPLRISTSNDATLTKSDIHPLFVTNSWIMYDGCNVLWVPHAYRPNRIIVRDNQVVFGLAGKVDVMEFDFRIMPRSTDYNSNNAALSPVESSG